MPYRKTPLVAGQFYHVFNRSIARLPIFKNKRDYERMMRTINYYRYPNPPLRFSFFDRLPADKKEDFLKDLKDTKIPMVEIISYCLMPNHFHFLLRPLTDFGVSHFVRDIQHSYSKYFNTKNDRSGSLFQGMFKAVLIETDEQFIHVSRYIHLNPVSSYLIEINALRSYPWSSFKDLENFADSTFVNFQPIMEHYKTAGAYRRFVFDQADYQRALEKIKHLTIEQGGYR